MHYAVPDSADAAAPNTTIRGVPRRRCHCVLEKRALLSMCTPDMNAALWRRDLQTRATTLAAYTVYISRNACFTLCQYGLSL